MVAARERERILPTVSIACFLVLLIVSVPSSTAQAESASLIDNNTWTYFLSAGEIANSATQGSHAIVTDFGGSLKVSISGAPGALDGYQAILAPIHAGDTVTLTLAHSDLGNFSGISFYLGDDVDTDNLANAFHNNGLTRDNEPVNQAYDVTWLADKDYAAGTDIYFHAVAWPGSADYWLIDAAVIPEPATLSLVALGGLALLRRRRR